LNVETIGLISGLLTIASVIPYSIRTYQRKIHPNLTSWALWTAIGLALLLTYKSSGAKANIWPAIFFVANAVIIWVIKRLAIVTALGISNILWVLVLALVVTLAELGVTKTTGAMKTAKK